MTTLKPAYEVLLDAVTNYTDKDAKAFFLTTMTAKGDEGALLMHGSAEDLYALLQFGTTEFFTFVKGANASKTDEAAEEDFDDEIDEDLNNA